MGILRAGRLPTTLQKDPISENQIGSMLGADTINKGAWSIALSISCVLVFILIYYRFAGMVACAALLANLLLILALMITINAALTLPGIAGLVLTVGMSVDANVLIFERIREELKRGATLRMAIRNGFSKATTTIVDANLTTLITAVVLYVIGTDQIKGFAVTLILGILMSMFTAIFCSRVVFDIAERLKWLKQLRMMQLLGATQFDFVSMRRIAAVISTVLIGIGLIAVAVRGQGIFDIDFTGGTSVHVLLNESMPVDEVRSRLQKGLENEEVEGSRVTFSLTNVDVVTIVEGLYDQYDKDPDGEAGPAQPDGVIVRDEWWESDEKFSDVDRNEDGEITPAELSRNRVFKVDTSIAKVERLKTVIGEIFSDDGESLLSTYTINGGETLEFTPAVTRDAAGAGAAAPPPTGTRQVDPQDDDAGAAEEEEAEDGPTDEDEQDESSDEESTAPDGDNARRDLPQQSMLALADDAMLGAVLSALPTADAAADATDAEEPSAAAAEDAVDSRRGWSTELSFGYGINAPTLTFEIENAAKELQLGAPIITLKNAGWDGRSNAAFNAWTVTLVNFTQGETQQVLDYLRTTFAERTVWPSSSLIGPSVAGDTQSLAIAALMGSLIGIVAYIWIRFQRVVFGLAAVVALVHDVAFTLGAIAISYWLANGFGVPVLGNVFGILLIDEFKISLPVVAAFLTIIGYSLNDTIVVFDRIREVRGKSPELTGDMVNSSINQTLGRTLLTSMTTLIVVSILYAFGGQEIHGFAFALLVGVIVGTYSSVFVASPILLWLLGSSKQTKQRSATV